MIIEKHWRGLTSRNVCDFFMEEVNKYREREDVPPIITTSKYYLVSVFRDDLFVLAVVTNEVRMPRAFWLWISLPPLSISDLSSVRLCH